ncbi:STY4528 family pathogenicity island replication protein [Actinobacillus pleuropneumoniae]|uniref:STY4528 family pathogenicity island replication protein n=1 Tax=Actinobacillus pleuropneumoniae TaxID=715 RepID=UPI003B017D26
MNMNKIITQNIAVATPKLLEKANQKTVAENNLFQGLLFVGNKHETVPLRLLTDKYLTPRAKTAWQLIKLNAYQFQGTAFPSYDELALWLSDRAFQGKKLSRKIVSQTLLLLRLTRWLTLCETIRSETGQILGNVYIMNDEPLSVSDCVQLNDDYLRLLEKSAKHKDPLVQEIATAIIDEMLCDESQLWHAISHIDVIRQRYEISKAGLVIQSQHVDLPENLTKAIEGTKQQLLSSPLSSSMELNKNGRELSEKRAHSLSSDMELSNENSDKSLILDSVPYRNSGTKYSTSTNISTKYSTVGEEELLSGLDMKLTTLEKQQLAVEMNTLDAEMRKAVLFEVKERISSGSIRKPLGYLFSMIRRAKNGDFKPYMLNKATQHEKQVETGNVRNFLPNYKKVETCDQAVQQKRLDILNQLTHMVKIAS